MSFASLCMSWRSLKFEKKIKSEKFTNNIFKYSNYSNNKLQNKKQLQLETVSDYSYFVLNVCLCLHNVSNNPGTLFSL